MRFKILSANLLHRFLYICYFRCMNQLLRLAENRQYVVALLLGLTLLAYSTVLNGDFVFDDDTFIVNNSYVHDLKHIPQIFTHSTTDGAGIEGGNFYRPLQSLCHAAIYTVFGPVAWPHHVFSVLLHALNACLLFFLLCQLGFSRISALATSAIFSVHPINTEAVAYISGLSDPLSLMFMLLSWISYLRFRRSAQPVWFAATIAGFVAALFTKESSIMFPGVLLLTHAWLAVKKEKSSGLNTALLIVAAAIGLAFLYLKFTVFNFTGQVALTAADNAYTQSLWVRFVTFCTIFPRYMGMLIFPINQYIEKPYFAYETFTLLGVGGLMLLGALIYIAYYSFRGNRLRLLFIGCFLLFLLPVSGIIPTNAIYLEHWLYLPFTGVAIALASFFDWAFQKNKSTTLAVLFVVLLGYTAKSMMRNSQWADAVTFYKNEIKQNKNSARMYNNLAMVYSTKGNYNGAIQNYIKAIQLYDVYPQTHHNLAQAYLKSNQIPLAIAEEYRALQMQPAFIYSLNSLYSIYTSLHDEARASRFATFIQMVQNGTAPAWKDIEQTIKQPATDK